MPNSGPLVISWFVLCRQSAVHSGRVRVEIKVKSPDSRLIIHVVRVQIRVGVGSMHGLGFGPDSHADSWRLLCSSRASCFPFNRSYRRLRQFFCFSYFVFFVHALSIANLLPFSHCRFMFFWWCSAACLPHWRTVHWRIARPAADIGSCNCLSRHSSVQINVSKRPIGLSMIIYHSRLHVA